MDSEVLAAAVSGAAAPQGDGNMKAETFFTEKEKETIAATIHEVETRTAGEVAVMVVDQSDDYPEGQILAAVVAGVLPALFIADFYFAGSLWLFAFTALFFSFAAGWLVRYMPMVKRLFTPDSRLELQVKDRALAAFYEKGLYKTRDQTGVLFFISLFERKVWILADRGIYEKIPPENLQEYARGVAVGIRSGHATGVLCTEIRNVGKILAHHFPIKDDDTNELSNEVIIGK